MIKSLLKTLGVAAICLFCSLQLFAQAKVTVIKAGRMIDTVSGRVLRDQTIVIEGDKIKAVGSRIEIPEGAEIIDLSDKTVLPG